MPLESQQSVPLETSAAAAGAIEQFEPDTTFMLETADQDLTNLATLQKNTAQQADLQQLQHTTANELVWVDTEWPLDISFDDASYGLPTVLFNDHHGHHPGGCG